MSRAARDSLIVGAVALLVRLPAFFAPQPLGFDDGQFAMSVIAMRHGGLPFREVFSSQGPLFLPIAWLGDLLTFRTIDSPRTASVLRIDSDVAPIRITPERVVRAASGPRVCAVVITSRERFGSWPDLPARLERIGYRPTVRLGDADDGLGLWQRARCRP